MADIKLQIDGDSKGAQSAMRGAGAAAGDMGDGAEEAAQQMGELDQATEEVSKGSDNLVLKFALVAKAAKEIIKFVGDSVKEYLASADASKQLVAVATELDDVQKGLKHSIGEAALELANQARVADAARGALDLLQTLLKGDTEENIGREKRMAAVLEARAELASAKANELNLTAKAASDAVDAAEIKLREALVAQGLETSLADSAKATVGNNEKLRKARAEAAQEAELAKEKADRAAEAERAKYFAVMAEQQAGEEALLEAQRQAETYSIELSKDQTRALETELKERAAAEKKAMEDAIAERKKAAEKAQADLEKQQHEWAAAADAIGGAFVSALTDQLNKLASGGELDAALFVGEILAATISVAGSVIGSALGQPALGSAIGNLAAMGVRAGASAISADNKKHKTQYHDGGWVGEDGLPRYHSGAWVGADEQMAILQHGERVLSRTEVGNMGGRSAIDSAASGRSGNRSVSINVTAVDAKSVKELFVGDGSRGIREAVRTGQGALPRLLKVSPR